ncbi:DUF3949 domain-containing protein [Cytobacillus sp. IB215316]|uniref:DUF3949 domain-containing protein n=1 Tax=Cytobacillus sp. IB215316 TaxID=3097354 RepID=UPI002A0E153C|nr:DUF3949 domain-containing protein [Cytobacillus sp. IB215316]MDX8361593.1 DUF3949 domain-containing protein [Cytobacillus sp. IB215316]
MNDSVLFIIIMATLLLIINVVMIPIQYAYFKKIEEEKKNKQLSQGEFFDAMEFQEQLLHFNAHSSIFIFPANFIAYSIYKKRVRRMLA